MFELATMAIRHKIEPPNSGKRSTKERRDFIGIVDRRASNVQLDNTGNWQVAFRRGLIDRYTVVLE
jgi:hypothetical protein